ncbi:uncharacterized protein YhhL (DUF1145 family) [Staphylococcus auricularis]|uniref:DUF2929 domain-containing protein n=1 Tax=Staphylococcus auricularis TaxID=29379 RepID=A0AAP8TTV0_9STAP|nr:DUF2929 family protein [Staphylococcus auricularis]MBM0868789.1 DUF2929 family protein [Staphylococcus auricularis]MCE5037657.1 DUF2929 family protein [Staphylococcus auricularis]MCG7341497.1 YjzD family protein [Staphylococcus auricularis]MDC6326289.1 DUF2929 family protein [Staphylococcus auricularis]MDN4533822.1 DUF2929 family protein [Staphylococcus auricularis]
MKYIMVFVWAVLLLEMVGFVLNSLNGGGPLNLVVPVVMAVVFTIFVGLFDLAIKAKSGSYNK